MAGLGVGAGSWKILTGVLVHRMTRPLRGSVSCGSGSTPRPPAIRGPPLRKGMLIICPQRDRQARMTRFLTINETQALSIKQSLKCVR